MEGKYDLGDTIVKRHEKNLQMSHQTFDSKADRDK